MGTLNESLILSNIVASGRMGMLLWGLSFSSWATTYTKCPLQRPKLLRGQDDIEGIRLRRREADGPIPWIPAVRAMVFGSFVHRCIGEIFVSQVGWLVRPPHIIR